MNGESSVASGRSHRSSASLKSKQSVAVSTSSRRSSVPQARPTDASVTSIKSPSSKKRHSEASVASRRSSSSKVRESDISISSQRSSKSKARPSDASVEHRRSSNSNAKQSDASIASERSATPTNKTLGSSSVFSRSSDSAPSHYSATSVPQSEKSVVSHRSSKSHKSYASIESHPSAASAHSLSAASAISHKSSKSHKSAASHKSATSHKSTVSHSSSSKSNLSGYSSETTQHTSNTRAKLPSVRWSGGGQSPSSIREEAIACFEQQNYSKSVLLFTHALAAYQQQDRAGLLRDGAKGKAERNFAILHGYRCDALFHLGAYDAAAKDGRDALECDKNAGSNRTLISSSSPYASNPPSGNLLNPDKGGALRSKVLCIVGHSFLRGGMPKASEDAFENSIELANKALEDAEDLTESERSLSKPHNSAVELIKKTIQSSKQGLEELERYKAMKSKLENSSRIKTSLDDLDSILTIAPAATQWHIEKVKTLISRKRWFAVANHCEKVAAAAVKWDGVLTDDLERLDPFPGIPSAEELTPDFFEDTSKGMPPHLRVLNAKATRDAVFRLPKELLPLYLRSLRLEERYGPAVRAGTALADLDGEAIRDHELREYVERKRFTREWDKLDRTIKLKEEGDALFRDGYFARALALYKECLSIDEDGADNSTSNKNKIGNQSNNNRPDTDEMLACAKPSSSGGKLHAVLHSNRAACFTSLGRYQDAIIESSHAIEIHSMYMKAILRRARCYVKVGDSEKANADFNRWIMLVEGAIRIPFPPVNQGPACFFDMPADVSKHELNEVKSEMARLGIKPPRKKSMNFFCCKSKVTKQVHEPANESFGGLTTNHTENTGTVVSRKNSHSYSKSARDPPAGPYTSLIKPRQAFDHPLDAPSVVSDFETDFYSLLELDQRSSQVEIKQAYHKLAIKYHPDRNNSSHAEAKFQELKMAYDVLSNEDKRRTYDRKRAAMEAGC